MKGTNFLAVITGEQKMVPSLRICGAGATKREKVGCPITGKAQSGHRRSAFAPTLGMNVLELIL